MTAVEVKGLSKEFAIGGREALSKTFREMIVDVVKAPFGRLASQRERKFWALKDVAFQIQPGEVVAIIGRNGAGKSTLLKILSRIMEPTLGEVRIRGRVSSLLEVGTGFHPELTGRENIFLNGAILGMSRNEIQSRFSDIVKFAEIEEFLDTSVKHYSSGMYVRLAFSVAVHLQPDVLIIDEVLAVGDSAFQQKSIDKMVEIAKSGKTLIFVSHNLPILRTLCKRAILLDRGQVRADGETDRVVAQYLQEGLADEQADLSTAARHPSSMRRLSFKRVVLSSRHVNPDEPLTVSLWLDASGELFQNLVFGIAILDAYGATIYHLCNLFVDPTFVTHRDDQTGYSFILPHISLRPGRYTVTLFVRAGEEIEDWIPAATSFDVMPGDRYRSRYAGINQSVVYPEFRFEIQHGQVGP